MFTPQRKAWSGWSLTPRGEKNGTGSVSNPTTVDGLTGKGKSIVAFTEPRTPQNGVGLVDDVESLAEKVSELENEVSFKYISENLSFLSLLTGSRFVQ